MADEARTVTVWCRVVNGITLSLFGPGYDDGTGTGYRPIVTKDRLTLAGPHGIDAGVHDSALHSSERAVPNQVDPEFWAAWVDQNRGKNPMFDGGFLFEGAALRRDTLE